MKPLSIAGSPEDGGESYWLPVGVEAWWWLVKARAVLRYKARDNCLLTGSGEPIVSHNLGHDERKDWFRGKKILRSESWSSFFRSKCNGTQRSPFPASWGVAPTPFSLVASVEKSQWCACIVYLEFIGDSETCFPDTACVAWVCYLSVRRNCFAVVSLNLWSLAQIKAHLDIGRSHRFCTETGLISAKQQQFKYVMVSLLETVFANFSTSFRLLEYQALPPSPIRRIIRSNISTLIRRSISSSQRILTRFLSLKIRRTSIDRRTTIPEIVLPRRVPTIVILRVITRRLPFELSSGRSRRDGVSPARRSCLRTHPDPKERKQHRKENLEPKPHLFSKTHTSRLGACWRASCSYARVNQRFLCEKNLRLGDLRPVGTAPGPVSAAVAGLTLPPIWPQ